MSYETADILNRAADVIEQDGWHKGDFYPGAGQWWDSEDAVGLPKCVRGALRAAIDGPMTIDREAAVEMRAAEAVVAALGVNARPFTATGFLPSWNDAPERTEQEVLDTLRLAAKQERCAEDGVA